LTPEDVNTLRALEVSLWTTETRFDPALMEQTLDKDFVEFGRSGRRYERAEMIFPADQMQPIDIRLPLPDYSVDLIAPDVALVTYTSDVRYDGTVHCARRSSLWRRVDGSWKLRFHQGTPV
jgi:hypothetical protein